MGDPAGIGPEVLLKGLASSAISRQGGRAQLTILGDLAWLRSVSRRLRIRIPWSRFRWIDLASVPPGCRPGALQPAAGRAAHGCLAEAVRYIKEGAADGLVTAPVSKEAIVKAGIPWIGHTEFLSRAFQAPTVMMFVTKGFRVSLVTTHLSLRRMPGRLRRAEVLRTLKMTRAALVGDFGIRRPRIGLAALNPHAGEGGLFGEEERRVLIPAVRAMGRSVQGPLAADSLMEAAARGRYDAVVALYHDQALIPVKLIGWQEAVNVTLGLPFVRTSPVHGTAFDIAGQGRADPRSMISAIELAIRLANSRRGQTPRGLTPLGFPC